MSWLSTSCTSGTLCFELAKGIPAAMVALAIGIPTIAIAVRQYLLSKAKLKLDLFDKRFKVYEEIHEGFTSVLLEELTGTHEPDIDSIWKRWDRLGEITGRREQNNGNVLPEDADAFKELTLWFNKESNSGIHEKFAKYLRFDKWH